MIFGVDPHFDVYLHRNVERRPYLEVITCQRTAGDPVPHALPQFGHRARLSTYLYRIVVNVAQDEWKRRRRPEHRAASLSDPDAGFGDRLADHAPTAQAVLERRELQAAVDALLEELPPAERAVLVLFHQEERRYDEIAAVLDVPVNTVRTHLHRGRSRLARLLKERLGRDDV